MDTMMGRRGVAWRTPSVSGFGLKMFACAAMLIYNIGISVVEHGLIHLDQYTQQQLSQALSDNSDLMMLAGVGSVMQMIGGLAVPIFAFLLVEGFRNTSSYKRYLLSVIVFALISEVPYDLAMQQSFWDLSSQNAMIGTAICLLMLYFLDMFKERKGFMASWARFCIVLGAVVWAALFRVRFGPTMVLLTAVFYLFYARNVMKTVLGILISLIHVTGPLSFYGLWCYDGRTKHENLKYVFYAFYPLHLLVLGVVVTFFMS
ncbi:MAG: TraX family protein [Lachnospiraceae bacterium]|nr:TraX family protein [Lachnospiraceae bacterium]